MKTRGIPWLEQRVTWHMPCGIRGEFVAGEGHTVPPDAHRDST